MLYEQQLGSAQVNLRIFFRNCARCVYNSGTTHIISAKIVPCQLQLHRKNGSDATLKEEKQEYVGPKKKVDWELPFCVLRTTSGFCLPFLCAACGHEVASYSLIRDFHKM